MKIDHFIRAIDESVNIYDLREVFLKCKDLLKYESLHKAFFERIEFLRERSLVALDVLLYEDLEDEIKSIVGNDKVIVTNKSNRYYNKCLKEIRGKEFYLLGDFSVKLEDNLLERVEKALILYVLEACNYNRVEASKKLGVTRRKVQYKISDYINEDLKDKNMMVQSSYGQERKQ